LRGHKFTYLLTKIGTEVATSHVTLIPLSRSKGQRSTCRGGAYCGGLPHTSFFFWWRSLIETETSTM